MGMTLLIAMAGSTCIFSFFTAMLMAVLFAPFSMGLAAMTVINDVAIELVHPILHHVHGFFLGLICANHAKLHLKFIHDLHINLVQHFQLLSLDLQVVQLTAELVFCSKKLLVKHL